MLSLFPIFIAAGAVLEFSGIILVTSPVANRLVQRQWSISKSIIRWGYNWAIRINRYAIARVKAIMAKVSNIVRRRLKLKPPLQTVEINLQIPGFASVSVDVSQGWILDPTAPVPNRLAAIERAIQSIQEQLNRQPEILKPDFQEAASEIVNRETILLRKDLDDVASFPKIRRAGFVFLLVGVALTGIGNLGALELLW